MTSTTGSETLSPRTPKAVKRAAVVTHGKPQTIGPALARLTTVAREAGVELRLGEEESAKHGLDPENGDSADVDIAVVLGGDGTMLRALGRYLDAGVPVIGVNFGNVGFLASIDKDDLEEGLARVFAGEYRVEELPTLDVEVGEERRVAVNDLVVASAVVGRMIQLEWAIGGETLGRLGCDGLVCSTPPGSTGYNFSNGGPVLVWGLDAMAVTFVAPAHPERTAARRPARYGVDRVEPNPGRRRDRPGRRPQRRRSGARRPRPRPRRRAAVAARHPAGGDVLQPLPPDLCFVAFASRISCSCVRESSHRRPA